MSRDPGEPPAGAAPLTAVILAGGRSARFGSDKLAALLDDRPLLDLVLAGLPDDADCIVVGPPRPARRVVRFVREEPPGGGPAAAMITGVAAAVAAGAAEVVVLPGDTPLAGAAVPVLRAALRRTGAAVVVAADEGDREQPLQLAMTRAGAQALLRVAGAGGGAGESARALVARLTPAAHRQVIPAEAQSDIDTVADLQRWQGRLP